PWFVLAEKANPGFLQYIFLHENILRFISKDYGDRYGTGHPYPFGSSWWMMALLLLPWTPLFIYGLLKNWRGLFSSGSTGDMTRTTWPFFFFWWALSPALFFTFVRQLTPPYFVPAAPGCALLLCWLVQSKKFSAVGTSILILGRLLAVLGVVFA